MRSLIYLSLAILFSLLSLCFLEVHSIQTEGFTDLQGSYEALQTRLKKDLEGYCELTTFVQDQMKKMYSTTPGTDIEATILQTYKSVYTCTDELASSRASCKAALGKITPTLKISGDFVDCSTYTRTPKWDKDKNVDIAIFLSNVPDDLANRVTVECEYYRQVLQKLQDGLELAKNPPGVPPDSSNSPAKDSNGNSWSVGSEGFVSCSPAAAQAKLEQQRKDALVAGSTGCKIPDLASEIARINAILDSSSLKDSLKCTNGALELMKKIQADIEAIKKKWGDDGPKKSYVNFKGGDRIAGLLFSMQQVR